MSQTPFASLPEHVKQIDQNDQFAFSCHPGVPCFTECCRMLELALTPYDVLRLRQSLKITSREVLDLYVIEEFEESDIFPRFYLTMVDDGRASCVFVAKEGCSVYLDRPGACRAYPLGRATAVQNDGTTKEHFVIIREEHCQGFSEKHSQNSTQYSIEQGSAPYNQFNDRVAELTLHSRIRNGFRPNDEQRKLYTLALYDIDSFRTQLLDDTLDSRDTPLETIKNFSDEELLTFALSWLSHEFFN